MTDPAKPLVVRDDFDDIRDRLNDKIEHLEAELRSRPTMAEFEALTGSRDGWKRIAEETQLILGTTQHALNEATAALAASDAEIETEWRPAQQELNRRYQKALVELTASEAELAQMTRFRDAAHRDVGDLQTQVVTAKEALRASEAEREAAKEAYAEAADLCQERGNALEVANQEIGRLVKQLAQADAGCWHLLNLINTENMPANAEGFRHAKYAREAGRRHSKRAALAPAASPEGKR